MIRHQAGPATSERYVLAEGPVWDGLRERLLWVDINGHHILFGELHGNGSDAQIVETGRLTHSETVGAVVCSAAGDLLVAGASALFPVPVDGPLRSADGTFEAPPQAALIPLIPAGKNSRLNDGGCDPAGRFLVGSLALDDRQQDEQLLRVESSGQVTVIDDRLGLSNGLAWSPDGAWFYSIDTIPGLIWIRSYDSDSGRFGERRVLLKVDGGFPDGMCVDAEGNLWVAIWGAGEVRCYSPTGALLASVEVAAPNTSSIAFAGPDLDTLVVTTASEQLSAAQKAQYPDSGKLFTASVGVTGLSVPYWSGL